MPANACTPVVRVTTRWPPTSAYLRSAVDGIIELAKELQRSLLDLAEQNADTVMPGFTHLQVAQPVTFGHHLLAYVENAQSRRRAFADGRKRINRMPLGSARWPAPAADRPRLHRAVCWVLTRCAKTRWMRFPTAISRLNSPPPPR